MKKLTLTVLSSMMLGCYGFSAGIVLDHSVSVAVELSETLTFKVNGTEACKAQIENIVMSIEGVTSASWNATTKIITIEYNPETVKKDRFYVALAEGGYDNQGLHAKKANYDELDAACKYVREPEND